MIEIIFGLLLIYWAYILAIGMVYKFEISFLEGIKKSVTLPLTPFKRLKPLTPLQKEIRGEERTIKEIKQQIADIQRLDDLKQKRDDLFAELGEADFKARTGKSTEPEKHVIAIVDGVQLPHAFDNERKAIEHIEKYYPKAYEIEWKEVF